MTSHKRARSSEVAARSGHDRIQRGASQLRDLAHGSPDEFRIAQTSPWIGNLCQGSKDHRITQSFGRDEPPHWCAVVEYGSVRIDKPQQGTPTRDRMRSQQQTVESGWQIRRGTRTIIPVTGLVAVLRLSLAQPNTAFAPPRYPSRTVATPRTASSSTGRSSASFQATMSSGVTRLASSCPRRAIRDNKAGRHFLMVFGPGCRSATYSSNMVMIPTG